MATKTPVSVIISTEPVVGNSTNKFSQVLRLFTEFPVHHLPIVDPAGKLIGIISSNDLTRVFMQLCNRKDSVKMDIDSIDNEIKLTDIMTANPVTVTSNDTISHVAQIFTEKKFLSVPVVDNGVLVGIVSGKDVIGFFANE